MKQLSVSEQLALADGRGRSLIHHSSGILAVLDRDGELLCVNPAMLSILGHCETDILGQPLSNLVHVDDRLAADAAITSVTESRPKLKLKWRLNGRWGSVRLFEISLRNLLADPEVAGILVSLRDITEQHQFERQLAHQAFHDRLTGLPNRALFMDHANKALKRSARSGLSCGLLYIDLDDFKRINDEFGHVAGDRVLVELAARLNACVRSRDTFARIGGDEFTVLLHRFAGEEHLVRVAETNLANISTPIALARESVVPLASIGISQSDRETSADSLLSEADRAMYHAKTNRLSVSVFRRQSAMLSCGGSVVEQSLQYGAV